MISGTLLRKLLKVALYLIEKRQAMLGPSLRMRGSAPKLKSLKRNTHTLTFHNFSTQNVLKKQDVLSIDKHISPIRLMNF